VIDLHCHVLPALDDGALDLEDSVAMARQAESDGIGLICATPHIRHDHAVVIDELAGRVTELNAELTRRGVAVRVASGGEVAETAVRGLTAGERGLVSLGGGGRWLLLEPAPGPLSEALIELVDELDRDGWRTLVAHPERHLDAGSADRLAALVARGALVQATAADVARDDGHAMSALAERGLIHVLGSDSHSARAGRPVALSSALERLARLDRLAPYIDWIAETAPVSILRGEDVSIPY
jgi:protein-tyrosine phosphatase